MPEPWENCTGGTIGEAVYLKLWHEASFFATCRSTTHSWQVVGVDTAFEHGIEVPLGTVCEPRPGGGYDDPARCPKGD